MNIITPEVIIDALPDYNPTLRRLEYYARLCHDSHRLTGPGSAEKLIRKLIDRRPEDYADNPPHESIIEHALISVRFVCSAKTAQSFERHRIASFTEASTRYINFSKGAHGGGAPIIEQHYWTPESCEQFDDLMAEWLAAMQDAERHYLALLKLGAKPEEARDVLPFGLRTVVAMSANLREWRHIFRMRVSSRAQPQARELMWPLYCHLRDAMPVFFEDLRLKAPPNAWLAPVTVRDWSNE